MKNLIFLDTETTGKEGRLIQLAFTFGGIDFVDLLFKPPVPIEIEAMSVHHITEEMVEYKQKFVNTLHFLNLQEDLDKRVLVCHNAAFDAAVLEREGLKVGKKICTMKVAQTVWDFPQYKLQYLRYALHLKVEAKAHDAGGDVAVLFALFNSLVSFMKLSGKYADDDAIIAKMIQITDEPVLLKTVPFGKYRGQKFEEVKDRSYFQWMLGTEIGEDLRHTLNHYLLK